MGAVFAVASATIDFTVAHSEAVAAGMRITFAVAAGLIVMALAIAVGSSAAAARVSNLRKQNGRPVGAADRTN
jgi:cytochrome c biogenesis protein CcdA